MAAGHGNAWMPLYIGDYLRDTARLTAAEHGAYLLLIMDYWVNGPPPDDDRQLAAIARTSLTTWRRHRRRTMSKMFTINGNRWMHKRIEIELERNRTLLEGKRGAGKASAARRRAKDGTAQPSRPPEQAFEQPFEETAPKNGENPEHPFEHVFNSVRGSVRTQAQPQRTEERFKNLRGDCGSALHARDPDLPEGKADDDRDEVDTLVAEALTSLGLTPQQRSTAIHDPHAYQATVTATKRERWLNELATWVGTALVGDSRMAAWEAIEVRRSCRSRIATPPDVRRAVDQLSRMRNGTQHAEAAE